MQWLVDNNFSITEPEDDLRHLIKQQDNPLFRLIRIITHDKRRYNPYVIFVSSERSCKSEENIRHLVYEGIVVNGQRYVFSERSASMTRTGIFSFVDARIADELNSVLLWILPLIQRYCPSIMPIGVYFSARAIVLRDGGLRLL